MTGGGKQKGSTTDNSRKYTSTTVCRFIKKQDSPTADYFRNLAEKLSFHSNNTGSILIEFAVCMPVLIILLYYINDLSKLKRYYDQTEFVAQQVVNMIQNISKKRESKAITLTDLSYIHCTAWLSVYPGTTMYQKNNQGYEFAHMPRMVIFYVKGVGNGKVSCLWRAYISMNTTNTPNSLLVGSAKNQNDAEAWITQYKTDAIPSEINPQLSEIKEGDKRIIVEVALGRRNGKNSFGKVISLEESMGFYMLTPKTKSFLGATSIFNSCAIFKPNQYLFTDDPPKKQ